MDIPRPPLPMAFTFPILSIELNVRSRLQSLEDESNSY